MAFVAPTGVGVYVSTLNTLLKYAELSAAPLPVVVPLLGLPIDVVVEPTTVAVTLKVEVNVEVVAGRTGVIYVVVVVNPEEIVSVCVVVTVVFGAGQTGSESTVLREPSVRVRVVIPALAVARRAARRRDLIAIARIFPDGLRL